MTKYLPAARKMVDAKDFPGVSSMKGKIWDANKAFELAETKLDGKVEEANTKCKVYMDQC